MALTYRVYFTLSVTNDSNSAFRFRSVRQDYEGSTWLRKTDPPSFGDISAYVDRMEMNYVAQSLLSQASGRHWTKWRQAIDFGGSLKTAWRGFLRMSPWYRFCDARC